MTRPTSLLIVCSILWFYAIPFACSELQVPNTFQYVESAQKSILDLITRMKSPTASKIPILLRISRMYASLGDLDAAQTYAAEALHCKLTHPDKVDSQLNPLRDLAFLEVLRCNFNSADQYLQQALKEVKDTTGGITDYPIETDLVTVNRILGKCQEAKRYEKYPNSKSLIAIQMLALARSHYFLNQNKQSILFIDRALQFQRIATGTLPTELLLQAASIYENLGNFKQCIASRRQAVLNDISSVGVRSRVVAIDRILLASALAQCADYVESAKVLRTAIIDYADPSDPQLKLTLLDDLDEVQNRINYPKGDGPPIIRRKPRMTAFLSN